MPTNDEVIKSNVLDQLIWDDRIDSSEINITVDKGNVTLSGYTPNFNAKSAAMEDARDVNGVVGVDNKLEMKLPDSVTIPSDEEILAALMDTFENDPDIASYKVEVQVENGWVTLEGTVDALWKKEQIESDVYRTKGVLGVRNNLAVVPSDDVNDEDIALALTNALKRNKHIEPDNLDIIVENGHVKLEGSIQKQKVRSEIKKTCLFTDGVRSVEDNLVIKYPET
jgi:osmotically-inducible protein OsmY